MCGIAVIFGDGSIQDLNKMLKVLHHRGPDDTGIYQGQRCLMGHKRLSIIDVEGGRQPIYNETGTMCIVYNGEVYNFMSLRDGLGGHKFKTKTDTEVVLHLYEEKGPECVNFLDGMFAFSIWDGETLFIARDRLGIKPLYYAEKNGTMFFASEIKALLPFSDNIKEFPPGYTYSSKKGFLKFYQLPEVEKHKKQSDTQNIKKNIQKFLINAVSKRLVSDVPVGIFLSGGLDSSIIASIAVKYRKDLRTFSVGVKDVSEDLRFAEELSEKLGTKHHQMFYTKEDMLSSLEEIIYYLESFDTALVRSSFPCYFVSKLAKKNGVKVILTGEGADELFAGYEYLREYKNPDDLEKELYFITSSLHNTNLQRVDRMTMANSVEGRVPFLDIEFMHFVFSISSTLKMFSKEKIEKLLLRDAFKGWLPESILWRKKEKFSKGAGSSHLIWELAEKEITDAVFEREKDLGKGLSLHSKEELYYYRIFKKHFPSKSIINIIGKSQSI